MIQQTDIQKDKKNKNYQEKVKENEELQEKLKLAVFLKYWLEFNHMEWLIVLIWKKASRFYVDKNTEYCVLYSQKVKRALQCLMSGT